MPRLWTFVTLLMASAACFGQVPASSPVSPPASTTLPELPKDPAAILAAAAPYYDFASPTMAPWHMKVSYHILGEKGQPRLQGTYEYWWASPMTYRSTWTRPGMEQTDWQVNGQHYHFGQGPGLEYYERELQADLLMPLPKANEIDPNKVRLERREQSFGAAKLPCVVLEPKTERDLATVGVETPGIFPTYCFEPDRPVVRAHFALGSTSVSYNKISNMQGHFLPRETILFEGGHKVLIAGVDAVNGIASTLPELIPPPDLKPSKDIRRIAVSSGVAQGNLLKQVPPNYPEDAKRAGVSGQVVLQALIGVDGHVHGLRAVSGPTPSLIAAAMQSVSQWLYRPYLLNGDPVDVDTTINVVFRLGN